MEMKKIKAVALVLIVILCGAAFTRVMQVEAKANAVQEKLSGEVFRFHVLANSDSKEDQKLKMKVKEAVRCEFPDKTYGDITFPAGWYDALRIRIGKAQGHNWWCVLYPNLCFMDSVHAVVPKEGQDELQSVLTDEEYAMIVKGTPVKIKWFFLQLTE